MRMSNGLTIGASTADDTTTTTTTQQATALPDVAPGKPGDPAYEDWLVAKTQERLAKENGGNTTDQPSDTSNDQLILGKFKSQDDLVKAYQELEAKATKQNQTKETTTDEAPKTTGGVDYNKYTQEIVTSGELSEASYKELEKQGMPKALVDQYIEGQKALMARETEAILAPVGGREAYTQMTQWAAANLSQEELARFDKNVVASKESAALAIDWLHQKYKAANGRAATRVSGIPAGASSNSSAGFASQAEAVAAMKDKRYQSDPAYRAEVARKMANKTY